MEKEPENDIFEEEDDIDIDDEFEDVDEDEEFNSNNNISEWNKAIIFLGPWYLLFVAPDHLHLGKVDLCQVRIKYLYVSFRREYNSDLLMFSSIS